jgi:hypothetical protein
VDDIIAVAKQQLKRIKVALTQADLNYAELPDQVFGVGVAVGFSQAEYVVLSVMAGGMENQLMMTGGILKDVNQDRLAALDACNRFNQSNTAFPVFLHDAEIGWSILVQQTHPIEVVLDVPEFFIGNVRSIPQIVAQYRETLAKEWSLGGRPWAWNEEDHRALLMSSML